MGQLKNNYMAHHFTNWGNFLLIPEVLYMSLEAKIDPLCIQKQTKYKNRKTLIIGWTTTNQSNIHVQKEENFSALTRYYLNCLPKIEQYQGPNQILLDQKLFL